MRGREIGGDPLSFHKLEQDQQKWTEYNETLLEQMFSTTDLSRDYSYCRPAPTAYYHAPAFSQKARSEMEKLDARIGFLSSIVDRLDLYSAEDPAERTSRVNSSAKDLTQAFVVHGRDEAAKESAARFLERLGIRPIILHEQASRGKTIIEKLEHYADVPFAVVLLTPDDEGRQAGSNTELRPRARQNVILELGYFVGLLKRERVCALYKGDLDLPSDWDGVVWVRMDDRGAWKLELAHELKAAGFAVDLNAAV